jgi:translation elongation factor EF-G
VSWRDLCNAFVTGFDIATVSGPLCEEPMLGAVFIIENVQAVKKPQTLIKAT